MANNRNFMIPIRGTQNTFNFYSTFHGHNASPFFESPNGPVQLPIRPTHYLDRHWQTSNEASQGIQATDPMIEAYELLKARSEIAVSPSQSPWVPRTKLHSAWHEIGLRDFLEKMGLSISDEEHRIIRDKYLYLISTLVMSRWRSWTTFKQLFLDEQRQEFWDSKFPISDKRILQNCLDEQTAELFCEKQYMFAHVILVNRGIQEIPAKQVLPFSTSDHIQLGKGASAYVFRELIPAYCWEDKDKNVNAQPLLVARKVVAGRTIDNEVAGTELLRKSITTHNRIVEILSVYRRGDDLNIIYPLALDDLEKFMYTDNILFDDDNSLEYVLSEIGHLASGLAFLHDNVRDPITKGHISCHMDFRPKNILVFPGTEKSSFELKISDFGITKFQMSPNQGYGLERKDIITNKPLLKESSDTKTSPKRPEGTHQAPEMTSKPNRVGRKSDVWSLACVIIRLLERVLQGSEALVSFDIQRAKADPQQDDFFYTKLESNEYVLNHAVDQWLRALPDRNSRLGSAIFSKCKDSSQHDILQSRLESLSYCLRCALKIEEEQRTSARDIQTQLDQVCEEIRRLLASRSNNQLSESGPQAIIPETFDQTEPLTTASSPKSTVSQDTTKLMTLIVSYRKEIADTTLLRLASTRTIVSPRYLSALRKWLDQSPSSGILLYMENRTEIMQCIYYMASKSSHHVIAYCSNTKFKHNIGSVDDPKHIIAFLIGQLIDEASLSPDESTKIHSIISTGNIQDGLLIFRKQLMQLNGACIICIDDFSRVLDQAREDCVNLWRGLFSIMGCGKVIKGIEPVPLACRVIIRTSGSKLPIEELGYLGSHVSDPNGQGGRCLVTEFFQAKLEGIVGRI